MIDTTQIETGKKQKAEKMFDIKDFRLLTEKIDSRNSSELSKKNFGEVAEKHSIVISEIIGVSTTNSIAEKVKLSSSKDVSQPTHSARSYKPN